jgi:hypothetical protein
VALSPKDTAEMMRPAAGLHRYNAWPQLARKLDHSLAMHASPQHNGSAVVEPHDAAAVLAQINPENRDLHCLSLRIGCPKTLCPQRWGGARHPINRLKPHRRQCWVIPPKANSAFVAAMEDVLAVYTRPHDPHRPLVCLDETSKQLIAETRMPIPMKPGRAARVDYEYERNGTANLFMLFAPLEGWRHVKVTDRHTAIDYGHVLKDLADIHFPLAKTIVLIQDNLNVHSKASLYEAFPAAVARRLVERFEWHYTPKHGSWLDLAESELGILAAQCLDRRIPDKQTLIDEIAAWEHDRNAQHTRSDWRFTTKDARIKLKHLYPSV